MAFVAGDDADKPKEDDQLVPLTQEELNELTWDLNLSKGSALTFYWLIQQKP